MTPSAAPAPLYPPISGALPHGRLSLAFLGAAGLILLGSGVAPASGHFSWFLEVVPALAGILAWAIAWRRFPMSHLVYGLAVLHIVILAYGGFYTYAETPLGNWAKDAFGFQRNHFDRLGHLALGFFPAFIVREVLLRVTPLRPGGWTTFLVLSVIEAVAAVWELVEWWTTLLVAGDVGSAFLGSQGDVWDAQWDMFLAIIGAAAALLLLSRVHDRSIAKMIERSPRR